MDTFVNSKDGSKILTNKVFFSGVSVTTTDKCYSTIASKPTY